MAVLNARVDDRLIHGQVATSWIRGLGIQVIVVVDDRIAKDETQKAILKLSAPADTKVYALSVDTFIEKMAKGILDQYRVMLVFENVFAPWDLVEKGFPLDTLNIGGMRFKEGRKQFTKALSMSEEEIMLIKQLHNANVKVEHRMLIHDEPLDVMQVCEGMRERD